MKFKGFFLIFILSLAAKAQQPAYFPDIFALWIQAPSFTQSAYVPDSSKLLLNILYKNRLGPFSKISAFAGSAEYCFRKNANRVQVARLLITDERMGPYISHLNVQTNYVYQQVIREDFRIAAGISGGLMQVSYTAPSVSAFGSARLFDGKLGMSFSRKKTSGGVSINQLFNTRYEPLLNSFRLQRYASFYVAQKFDIRLRSSMSLFLRYDNMPDKQNNAALSFLYNYHHVFQCAAAYSNYTGISIFAGFSIPIGNDNIRFGLADSGFNAFGNSMGVNSLELYTGYSVK